MKTHSKWSNKSNRHHIRHREPLDLCASMWLNMIPPKLQHSPSALQVEHECSVTTSTDPEDSQINFLETLCSELKFTSVCSFCFGSRPFANCWIGCCKSEKTYLQVCEGHYSFEILPLDSVQSTGNYFIFICISDFFGSTLA